MNKLIKSFSILGLLSLTLLMPMADAQEAISIQPTLQTRLSAPSDGTLAPGQWVLTDQGAAQGASSGDDNQCKQLALMEQLSVLCFHAAANTSQNSQYLNQLIDSLIGNFSALQVTMVNGKCLVLFAINSPQGSDGSQATACQATYTKIPRQRIAATPAGEATMLNEMEPHHH